MFHSLLIGATGSGKSSWLVRFLHAVFGSQQGVLAVDPHGDLAAALHEIVPRNQINQVVLFNPNRCDCPAINPFRITEHGRHLVVSNLLASLRKLFGSDSFGPRTDHLLRYTFLALCEVRGATMQDAAAMLSDEKHRRWVLKQVSDPNVLRFWTVEFPGYGKQLAAEATAAPLNKLGALLALEPVRTVLTKNRPKFSAERCLDMGKIVIARLPKGELGEDGSLFLGGLLISAFQAAIMARSNIDPSKRKPFVMVIDEATSFAAPPLIQLLAEARKYQVQLVLATQSIAALEPTIRSAILGNVGELRIFRVGGEDAELLCRELAYEYGPKTLTSLGVGEYVERIAGGRPRIVQTPYAPHSR